MSTSFAASDDHIVKNNQLFLCLVCAIWVRTRVGDVTAASSGVKKICGTSAFLQRTGWAKFGGKLPASTPSNNIVCDFESLIRGQEKILSTKQSGLANSSMFVCLLRKSYCYVGFRSVSCFGSSRFVTAWVFKLSLLLYTEAGTKINCSISKEMVSDRRSNNCYEM